jgi:hypothetical protein
MMQFITIIFYKLLLDFFVICGIIKINFKPKLSEGKK